MNKALNGKRSELLLQDFRTLKDVAESSCSSSQATARNLGRGGESPDRCRNALRGRVWPRGSSSNSSHVLAMYWERNTIDRVQEVRAPQRCSATEIGGGRGKGACHEPLSYCFTCEERAGGTLSFDGATAS